MNMIDRIKTFFMRNPSWKRDYKKEMEEKATTDKSCRSCQIVSEGCPFNSPPIIDGFEHLDSYKHHRIDCEHYVEEEQ